MPSGGKKQTVGYKYLLGMHLALCHGPVDKITRARVDAKTAWQGSVTSGRIDIDAEDLFGGESREGGVSGAMDFESGGPAQAVNDYLLARFGAPVPAFRGVCCAVLRQMYLGMNPYLKRWDFRVQRIHTRQDGVAQWYDAKAPIETIWGTPNAIYIMMDASESMDTEVSTGVTRLDNEKTAINGVIDYLAEQPGATSGSLDIMIVAFGGTPSNNLARASILRRGVTTGDISSLKSWVSARTAAYGTHFPAAVADAETFFSGADPDAQRTSIFVTDGSPTRYEGAAWVADSEGATAAGETLLSISNTDAYAFNIDLSDISETEKLDNTPADSVPVVSASDPDALTDAITGIFGGQIDLNPAHIIRECLTDPDWGMGYADADIDDTAFQATADTLYDEGMGMSLLWDKQSPIEDFIQDVIRHIDAALYVDPATGLFVLTLIRDDYDLETLLTLNASNVDRVEGFRRPGFGELVNQVTVRYWDAATGTDASQPVTNDALVQMQGKVISETIDYPGFTNVVNATKAAQRDLRALSEPLASCTVYAHRVAASLRIGKAFILDWPELGANNLIMRVTGIAYGDGRSHKIRLQCTEDVFSTPTVVATAPPIDGWTDPVSPPSAVTTQLLVEAPYYELVQSLGQSDVDAGLAADPDLGYIIAAGASPTEDAINARLYTDAGAGYTETETIDFSPVAFLAADLPQEAGPSTVAIAGGVDLDNVVVGSHAQVDGELVRVDAISTTSATLGRGVLDTVPAAHSAGAAIVMWDEYAAGDNTEYSATETVNAKLLTVTGQGVLAIGAATSASVTLDSRAARPYAPGNVTVNGAAYPTAISGVAAATLSWSHRDRLQQTAGDLLDTTVASVGPESGTTYTLRIYGETDSLLRTEIGLTGTTYTYTAEAADSESPATGGVPAGSEFIVSMLWCEGADESTSIIDEQGHVWTASGNAQIDTSLGFPALYLDGATGPDSFIYSADSDDWHWPGLFTISFRFTPETIKQAWLLFQTNGSYAFGPLRVDLQSSGKINVLGSTNNTGWLFTSLESTTVLSPGTEYHIELSDDGTTFRLFIDGNLEASRASWSKSNSSYQLQIGGGWSGGDRESNGWWRDIRIDKGAALHTASFTPGSPGRPETAYRLNGRLRFELESVRDSLTSYQHHDITVLRAGYGFNYGKLYGGAS